MIELRPYQTEAIDLLNKKFKEGKRAVLLCLVGGSGKCHGKDTPILMYNGEIKMVQDIKPGDKLMGPDSKPRNVLSVCSGIDKMYEIIPKKGMIWTCNESHILSVIYSSGNTYGFKKGIPTNLSIRDYNNLRPLAKRDLCLYKTGVEFKEKKLPIDPYFLGLWIGDGTIRKLDITLPDKEILNYLKNFSKENNLYCKHLKPKEKCDSISFPHRHEKNKKLVKIFRDKNLICKANQINEKFIPGEYLINSRENRLQLLAGIIDTDGYSAKDKCAYEISTKYEKLSDQIIFLARSLGFYARKILKKSTIKSINFKGYYYRIGIYGDLNQIPCKIKRKQAPKRKQIKNHLRTGFKINPIGEGKYYGFELDKDGLYLLSDFTVTHNTTIASDMMLKAKNKGNSILFIAHRKELIKQCHKRLSEFGINAGIVMSGEPEEPFKSVQVGSIQTLQRRQLPPARLVIIDEAHRAIGPQYMNIVKQYMEAGCFVIGLTGTPFRTNKREGLNELFQDFVSNITCSMLIKQGFIVPTKVYGSGRISSKGMRTRAGEFREDDLMKAFDTEKVYLNLISNFEKYSKDKKAIIFCCSVKHSIRTTEEFLNRGYRIAHIDGNTPPAERDRIVNAFKTDQIQILCNYGILAEGFDCPNTEVVVLNLLTKSKIKYLQACWRASRPAPGKEYALIIDMADNCERFGFPDEDIEVSLEPEDETESNGVAPVKLCPCCSYMSHASAKSCNDCGEEFKKTEKEIKEEEFIELQKDKKERKWKKYTQKDWYKVKDEDLEEFAKLKGYKPFWVTKQREQRKAGRKAVKIKNFPGSKQEYYKKTNEVEKIYYGNRGAIDASELVFVEEDKAYVVFEWVKKPVESSELKVES